MKKIIIKNIIIEINTKLQYYLIINVNKTILNKYLFQLYNIKIDIETIPKFFFNEKIIIFFLFRL